jgi:hypothetical protein
MAPPMLARSCIRRAALGALKVLETTGGVKVINSPGVWTVQPEKTPTVLLRVSRTSKDAISSSTTNFMSTVLVEIESKLIAATGEDAQAAIEELDALVEQALLTNTDFVKLSQRISIEAETQITSEARNHVAGTQMLVRCELIETFDPIADAPDALQPAAPPLEGVNLHADLVSQFDPLGVYGDVLFPDAVQPAPRTAGPDGRDEGYVEINFPTS